MYKILLRRERVPDGVTPAFIADELPPVPVCRQSATQNQLYVTKAFLLICSRSRGLAEAHGHQFQRSRSAVALVCAHASHLLRYCFEMSLCTTTGDYGCPAGAQRRGRCLCKCCVQALQHRMAAAQDSRRPAWSLPTPEAAGPCGAQEGGPDYNYRRERAACFERFVSAAQDALAQVLPGPCCED